MRKLYCLASVTVIALGLASCNKEEIDSAKGPITIIANTESGVDTKTYLSGDDSKGYQVLWSEGDKITLLDKYGSQLTLSEGAGKTTATFAGMITDSTL